MCFSTEIFLLKLKNQILNTGGNPSIQKSAARVLDYIPRSVQLVLVFGKTETHLYHQRVVKILKAVHRTLTLQTQGAEVS
ncbi:hypothetical protein M758_UG112700 [Ceratodon purpureus]|nr:hypothetical protein M758_UG112700 [Ceratodon purpureus]